MSMFRICRKRERRLRCQLVARHVCLGALLNIIAYTRALCLHVGREQLSELFHTEARDEKNII